MKRRKSANIYRHSWEPNKGRDNDFACKKCSCRKVELKLKTTYIQESGKVHRLAPECKKTRIMPKKEVKITYRKGYPSRSCITGLIEEYFENIPKYCVFTTYAIDVTGEINWQRDYMNEYVNQFVDFLAEKGIEIKDIRLYNSPSTGAIKFTKKNKKS